MSHFLHFFNEHIYLMSHDYPQNTHLMWVAHLETELNATNELFLLTYSECEHTGIWGHTKSIA